MAKKKELDKATRLAILALAKEHGVTVRFVADDDELFGSVHLHRRVIKISKAADNSHVALSIFFHELGHLFCFENGIFKSFHRSYLRSWNEVRAFQRTALRAEMWVDRWAEREFKRLVRDGYYVRTYRNAKDRLFLRNYWRDLTPRTVIG